MAEGQIDSLRADMSTAKVRFVDLFAAVLNVGMRGLTLGSKFFFMLMVARLYKPEDVGLYGLMSSTVAIVAFAFGLEYHQFSTRVIITRPADQRASLLRDQAVLHSLVILASVLPLAWLFHANVLYFPLQGMLGWLVALTVSELFAHQAGNALIAVLRPLCANLVLFVRTGLWVFPAIAIAVAYPDARRLSTIFLAWLVGGLLSIVVAGWYLRDLGWRQALRQPIDWTGMRKGLRTAAPFVAMTASALGLLFLDRFIIEVYAGLEAVGIYTFFATITVALHTLVNTGVPLIRMPRLVKAYQNGASTEFRRELATMSKITVTSALTLSVLFGLGIFPVLRFVDKAVYTGNIGVFFILLLAALLRCVADLPLYSLYARNQDLRLLVINISAFVVSLLVNVWLVPSMSIWGAALGAVAGGLMLLVTASFAHVWH